MSHLLTLGLDAQHSNYFLIYYSFFKTIHPHPMILLDGKFMATYVLNKKIGFNYEILEKFETGIELLGFEVKSIKNNQGDIESAYVLIRGNEAFLMGADIPPYQAGNTPDSYERMRNRKLLLTKKEIEKLGKEGDKKGLTIVPVSLYNKGTKIKVSIAIVRGKRKIDKRQKIKECESDRDIERTLKNQRIL